MIYGSVLLRFGIVLNSEFSLENIYCSVEIVAGLIRKTLRVACVIFHLLLCALLLPTFQRTSINSTPTHTHTSAACAAHKLFLGSFDYSGQPQSSSAQLLLSPSLSSTFA